MISTKKKFGALVFICLFFVSGITTAQELEPGLYAQFATNKGMIIATLHYKQVPLTVINFAALAEGTKKTVPETSKKFYDGLTFHRVLKGFMIQGGDPEGSGSGGPGYTFQDEFVEGLIHDSAGTLSMANAGPDSNGSQFFITHVPTPWLNYKHTVFGKVVKGQDVVDKIEKGDLINSVTILRIGEEAEAFQTDEQSFQKQLKKIRDEKIAAFKKVQNTFETEMQLTYPQAEKLEPGLLIIKMQDGTGPLPSKDATVRVHVVNMLKDGQVVSSTKSTQPHEVSLAEENIYSQTLRNMKKGEVERLLISYTLLGGTYYETKTDMIVELELVEIK